MYTSSATSGEKPTISRTHTHTLTQVQTSPITTHQQRQWLSSKLLVKSSCFLHTLLESMLRGNITFDLSISKLPATHCGDEGACKTCRTDAKKQYYSTDYSQISLFLGTIFTVRFK